MRSNIYGTEIDNGLQAIVEEMHTNEAHCTPAHRAANKKKKAKEAVEEDAPETLEDDTTDESSCNTNREGAHDATDEDKVKCPHCNKVIQASSCGSH